MKKKVFKISFIILLIIILLLSCQHILFKYTNKTSLEKSIYFFNNNDNFPFLIDKIILYSSAYGKNKNTNFQQTNWVLDLYQYTDIAIYIKPNSHNLTASNTIKSLSIKDLNFYQKPNIGEPSLYYLDAQAFGTANFSKEYPITSNFKFTVLNDSNKENIITTNTPVLFSDLSNPITLKYVNLIYSNYHLPSHEIINFDGSLLTHTNTNLQDLTSSFSFTIELVSNDNQSYYYNLPIMIPLESYDTNILSGQFLKVEENLNYKLTKTELY